MKNLLTINIVKDSTISELTCKPNTIVLAKQTISDRNGEVRSNVRYIEVCTIEKTDSQTIVQSLLKYCIAEFLVSSELENDFKETGIKQRKIFNQFLGGTTIYRTNSEGKIASALVSEVPLRQTALNVKDYHAITLCKKENLKAAIYQHAKAIIAQCQYLSLVVAKVEKMDKEVIEVEEKIAEEKKAKATLKPKEEQKKAS